MAEASDSVVLRYFLTGDGLVAAKIRAMRAEILGLDRTVVKSNEAQLASAVASNKAAAGMMRFGSAAKWSAGIFGIGLAFGLVGTLHRATTFMAEQNVVGKQTEAQLIATGHAAGFTGEQLKKMAEGLAASTGQDPLQLQSAENRLLGFQNVRGGIFAQAVRDANDVSVAMHVGPEAAAKALGFALDFPATGFMRLQRLGVDLSQQNKAYIKELVARGQTEQAQLVILGAVEAKYKGSALMFGDTLPGQLGKLKFAIDEILAGSLQPLITGGTALVGALAAAATFIARDTAALESFKIVLYVVLGLIGVWILKVTLLAVRTAALWLIEQAQLITTGLRITGYYLLAAATLVYAGATWILTGGLAAAATATWALTVALLANPITWVVIAVVALAVGFYLLYTRVAWFHHGVIVVWTWIKQNWRLLAAILIAPIAAPIAVILGLWQLLGDRILALPRTLASAGSHMWDWIGNSFRRVMSMIIGLWNDTVGGIDLSIIGGPDLHIRDPFARRGAAQGSGPRATRSSPTRRAVADGISGPRAGMVIAQHPKEIHTHVHLNDKEIATAVTEYQHTAAGRR